MSNSKHTSISQQPHEKQRRDKRLGVVSLIQSLCPSEHHLLTPVRQGATSVKTVEETPRFRMTACPVAMISSEGIPLPSLTRSWLQPSWELLENREGVVAECSVKSRTGLNGI